MNSRGTSIYMSSTTLPKAIQYLTKLQAQSGQPSARVFEDAVASMLSHPEEQWEDIARRAGLVFTEDLRRQVHHLKESRLLDVMRRGVRDTPALQSVNDYAIMRETKESFDKLIRSRFSQPERYAVSDKVFFGTLESATVNAMITTVPDSDEFLVLINRALWDLAKLLPFTLATTLFTEQFTFRPYDPACDYPNSSLSSEIVAAIMTRSRHIKQMPPLPPRNHPISLVHFSLYRSIHDFIIGHEYGHFLRGHFKRDRRTETYSIGDLSLTLNTTAWRNEYEADRVGLDLAVIGAREFMSVGANPDDPVAADAIGRAMSLGFLGCWACLHLLFQMDHSQRRVYTVDSSHPPPALRIALMARTILSQQANLAMVQQAQELLRSVAQCVGVMFSQLSSAPLTPDVDRVRACESELQNLAFQEVLLDSHAMVMSQLKGILPAFRPPHLLAKHIPSLERTPLILSAFHLLADSVNRKQVTWDNCVSIVEGAIAILEKDAAVCGFGPGRGRPEG